MSRRLFNVHHQSTAHVLHLTDKWSVPFHSVIHPMTDRRTLGAKLKWWLASSAASAAASHWPQVEQKVKEIWVFYYLNYIHYCSVCVCYSIQIAVQTVSFCVGVGVVSSRIIIINNIVLCVLWWWWCCVTMVRSTDGWSWGWWWW